MGDERKEMKEDDMIEVFGEFIQKYLKQNERHMSAMLELLELLNDSIQKGFSDVEEQLENVGDAIRELDTEHCTCDNNRSNQNERTDNRS